MVNNRHILIIILQIMTLYNIALLGWEVKQIGMGQYELSKNIVDIENYENFDLHIFINSVIN